MAIISRKLSTYAKDVKALSDTPNDDGLTAAQLKAVFMGAADEEIKTNHNGLIDDLVSKADGSSGADNIGATAVKVGGSETVQGILEELKTEKVDAVAGKGLSTNDYDNTEKANVASNTSARHTHSNKALLDTYTQTEANLADAVTKKHTHANLTALNNVSGVNTGDQDLSGYALKTNVLEKTNTTAFTPTADHQPATKKYVDDNAGSVPYLSTINGLVTAIVDDDTKLPTSGAVVDYVASLGGGDMLKATYDPTNKSADAFSMTNMVEGTTNKIFTATERTKLSGIADNANNYSHPANHPPSIITQDSSNRFVTDAEKTTWNGKANTVTYTGTLASASWTGASAPYSQTITVTGMASTDNAVTDVALTGTYATDQAILTNFAIVYRMVSGTNQVTAYANAIPTADIPLQFKIVR